MSEIIIVGYQDYDFAKSLVVGEIVYEDFCLDLREFNSLIFTSKNAILSLMHNAQKYPEMQIWKTIPSYVIGKSTAKTLQDLGGTLAYISPHSYGEEFANFLSSKLSPSSSILYLRAKTTASSLDELLRDRGFKLDSQIAYHSRAKKLASIHKPPKNAILLFTSPSAYRFFLQNFEWDESYTAIALGKTTFQSFDLNISKRISPIQDIKKSIKLLQSCLGV